MEASTPNAAAFGPEVRERLSTDTQFKNAQKLRQEIEQTAEDVTPGPGRPKKGVREAQQAKEMIEVLEPLLEGINALVANRWPELEYSPDELAVTATLGGKVLSKYVDITLEKYAEEIMLITYLGSTGARKGTALYRRLRAEQLEAELAGRKGKNDADREKE